MREDRPGAETELMLKGYGLTTAEFYYRMPDYRHVLNSFIWQDYDLAPDYPKLFQFIEFWQEKIEGPLHSVRFTHRKLIAPGAIVAWSGNYHYQLLQQEQPELFVNHEPERSGSATRQISRRCW